MIRQVLLPVFYILLWFAFANDVKSLSTLRDQCLEFDIADLEGYVSTLNLTNVPTVDKMFAGFECPITALPFGFLRSDWTRLLLLRKMLAEESILAKKLERLIRILIIAYQKIEEDLVPYRYSNEANDRNLATTNGFVLDATTTVTGTDQIVQINHGDIKKIERSEDGNKQESVTEHITAHFDTKDVSRTSTDICFPQGYTMTDFLNNKTETFSTLPTNKLTEPMSITTEREENWDEKVLKEGKNEKDLVTSSKSSTSINSEVASVVNSRSTVKLNRFGMSTEKFNSIDSLSTVRTEISEETISQEVETERTGSYTINFHDSDDGGNRNIKDDRDFAFTSLPAGSSLSTEASANGRADFNNFDTDREKLKNDEKLKVSSFANADTVTTLHEESEKFGVTLAENISTQIASRVINPYIAKEKVINKESSDSSRTTDSCTNTILSTSSGNVLYTNQNSTSLESVNTNENIEAKNVDRDFATSTKAFTKSGPSRITVSGVTNRQDLKEATSTEVVSKKHHSDDTSSVARNSMDHFDPSWTSVHDVLEHGSEESDIEGFHPTIGNKLKKLSVFRKQPPGNVMNDYQETVQRLLTPSSKTTILSMNSIEDTNGFKGSSLGSRKRGNTNSNIENNFRFFYNLGGRSATRKKAGDNLDFIRVKCKDEST